ncbi:MAG TPA: 3-beta hydroxysteroid dehydrogenase [Microscillaceae bacterium]|nr:3-beta hydroxysteroid dehydrogenase [Microscillaceae bacterium]
MHILITGGAGFVGSNLAVQFKTKYPQYTITCLDNLKRRGSELNLPRFREMGIQFIHADIRNPEDLATIEHFDCLIDASAEPSVLAGITSPVAQVVNNNLMGTVNCLELAKKHQAAFIFLSTSRVYPIQTLEQLNFTETETRFEWSDDQSIVGVSSKGVTEDFPLESSRSFYGATKLASELLIQEYHALANLKTIINRCGVITGPWQMGKVDQGVVVLWVARHFWKKSLKYIGYGGLGKQVRDMLHIQDLFELIDLQVHQPDTWNGKMFNVGGGRPISFSLKELTQLCEEVTGNQIEIDQEPITRPADLRIYLTDHSKITNFASWHPKITPLEIISDVFEWLQANEDQLKPILG